MDASLNYSDQLVESYLLKKHVDLEQMEQRQLAHMQLAARVLERELPKWLGAFYDELVIDWEHVGLVHYAPRGMSINVGIVWRGISGAVNYSVGITSNLDMDASIVMRLPKFAPSYGLQDRWEKTYVLALTPSEALAEEGGLTCLNAKGMVADKALAQWILDMLQEQALRKDQQDKADAIRVKQALEKRFFELKERMLRSQDEEEIEATAQTLIAEYPDEEPNIRVLWQQRLDILSTAFQLRLEEDKACKELDAWMVRVLDVIARNRARLADLQRRLDEPFGVYELEYGMVADADDGERYIGTREIYVENHLPDKDWFFSEIRYGDVRKVRIYNPVTARKITQIASAGHVHLVRSQWVEEAQEYVRASYKVTPEEIFSWLAMLALEDPCAIPVPAPSAEFVDLGGDWASIVRVVLRDQDIHDRRADLLRSLAMHNLESVEDEL